MPNTSENEPKMPSESSVEETNKTTNPDDSHSNNKFSDDRTAVQTSIASDLPVLAKDSYYLSRLERELARAAVSKNKKSNQTGKTIKQSIEELEIEMDKAASNLEFEEAAKIRDEIKKLKQKELGLMIVPKENNRK